MQVVHLLIKSLRENVKKRPDFAGDYKLQKDELRYINEDISHTLTTLYIIQDSLLL